MTKSRQPSVPINVLRHARARAALALALLVCAAARVAQAQTYTVLYTFPDNGLHGAFPDSLLLRSADGNLYGETNLGGNCSINDTCGTLFRVSPDGKETVLHTFTPPKDGMEPLGNLVRYKGSLYGVTEFGGQFSKLCGFGCGTVFKVSRHGRFTVLHRFTGGKDGTFPGGLTRDASGHLYGTADGGINCPNNPGCGVVFKLHKKGKFTVLHRFAGGADGEGPNDPLVRDAAGNLYGTTYFGGQGSTGICFDGCGTVFKIDKAGRKTTLYEFTGMEDGANPDGGLVRDSAGNLYGTTYYGGSTACLGGCGVVFRLDPSGKETVLFTFTGGSDGGSPLGSLVRDAAGNLYGTAGGGNVCDRYGDTCGVVFKLDRNGQETVLYAFNGNADGAGAVRGLALDAAGNLYGATWSGGAIGGPNFITGCGVIFKIKP